MCQYTLILSSLSLFPRKTKVKGPNHIGLICRVSMVIKSFEHFVLSHLKAIILDVVQFDKKRSQQIYWLCCWPELSFHPPSSCPTQRLSNTIIPALLPEKGLHALCAWVAYRWIPYVLTVVHEAVETCLWPLDDQESPPGFILSPLQSSPFTNSCTSGQLTVKHLMKASSSSASWMDRSQPIQKRDRPSEFRVQFKQHGAQLFLERCWVLCILTVCSNTKAKYL